MHGHNKEQNDPIEHFGREPVYTTNNNPRDTNQLSRDLTQNRGFQKLSLSSQLLKCLVEVASSNLDNLPEFMYENIERTLARCRLD